MCGAQHPSAGTAISTAVYVSASGVSSSRSLFGLRQLSGPALQVPHMSLATGTPPEPVGSAWATESEPPHLFARLSPRWKPHDCYCATAIERKLAKLEQLQRRGACFGSCVRLRSASQECSAWMTRDERAVNGAESRRKGVAASEGTFTMYLAFVCKAIAIHIFSGLVLGRGKQCMSCCSRRKRIIMSEG